MAKREDFRTPKSKMTVVMLQVEAEDETLREGIRTITQALNAVSKPRILIPKSAPTAEEGSGPDIDIEEPAAENGNGDTEPETISLERTPAKARTFRTPEVVQVDFEKPMPLKQFLSEKKVGDNDNRRYLAIAAWFKEHDAKSQIGLREIYTAYRWMKWTPPDDIGAPFRKMKSMGLFVKGSAKSTWAINHIGEGRLNDENESGVLI